MKTILLTRGKVALVDDKDFEWLNQWKWRADISGGDLWYAVRQAVDYGKEWWVIKRRKRNYIAMHRLILGLTERNEFCDHIDGDGLNNQRCNLRKATHTQNLANARPKRGRLLKGVYRKNGKRRITWTVSCLGNYLGTFPSEASALEAYNDFLVAQRGEFARLNPLPEKEFIGPKIIC